MISTDVAVIGGGAAGLMAAITAARQGAKTAVIEHMDRVGKKILATGNGKCNLPMRSRVSLITGEKTLHLYCLYLGSLASRKRCVFLRRSAFIQSAETVIITLPANRRHPF